MRCSLMLLACLALPGAAGAVPVANAGFDADLSGWTVSGTSAAHDPLDVASSVSSGSALLTGSGAIYQCVAVTPGTAQGGAWSFIPAGQPPTIGLVDVSLVFFAQAGCGGHPFNTQLSAPLQPDPGAWAFLVLDETVPDGALSATFHLEIKNANGPFRAHFDDATLAIVPEPAFTLLLALALAALALDRRSPLVRIQEGPPPTD